MGNVLSFIKLKKTSIMCYILQRNKISQEEGEKYKMHNPGTKILDFQKRCIYNLVLFRADDSVCWLSCKDSENICLCPMPLTVCCSFIKA